MGMIRQCRVPHNSCGNQRKPPTLAAVVMEEATHGSAAVAVVGSSGGGDGLSDGGGGDGGCGEAEAGWRPARRTRTADGGAPSFRTRAPSFRTRLGAELLGFDPRPPFPMTRLPTHSGPRFLSCLEGPAN